jgi:PIN domain nuclease of toxin-antitoxin system
MLLWAAGAPRRPPRAARALLKDEANALAFGAVSLWEVAIEHQLGRADFRADARLLRRGLLDNG